MPVPPLSTDGRALLERAAARGELAVQRCTRCDRWVWFPRPACPYCFERSLEWGRPSGRGTVLSFTVIRRPHRPDDLPFVPIVLALIELAEGCQMAASLVGDDRTDARIGDPVRVTAAGRWSRLPQFALAREAERRLG
jgi:uncharacterized OB-fold protein